MKLFAAILGVALLAGLALAGPPAQPPPPSLTKITSAAPGRMMLEWTYPIAEVPNVESWTITRSLNGKVEHIYTVGANRPSRTQENGASLATFSFTLTNTVPGLLYKFHVNAEMMDTSSVDSNESQGYIVGIPPRSERK